MPDLAALEVEQLTVNYEKTAVLWDLNFFIPREKMVGVIGPNGAGKSTLLKAAMGLIHPVSGKISFFGLPLDKARKRVAYVPQRASVDWDFPITALDLVLMGSYGRLGLLKWVSRKEKEAANEALAQVGMDRFAHRQIGQLSGGQQQRLFIARALLQNADIYLMDEPFAGVDIATENALISLFSSLRDQGKTILCVHHDLSTAERYFNWIVLLNTCLIASGSPQDVFTQQNLLRTYGRSSALLDEAAALVQGKSKGYS